MRDTSERRGGGGSATNDGAVADSGSPAQAAGDVPRGELLGALAVDRRRTILSALAEECAPVDIRELARAVAEREAAPDSPSEDRVECAHVSLYHVDLPKLDHVGLVSYDAERGFAEARVDDLEAFLAEAMRVPGGD